MMEASERAACGGKEPLSWGEADRRARGMRRRTGKTVTPFHCRYCSRFHIGGSIGGNVGRRMKREQLEKIQKKEPWW